MDLKLNGTVYEGEFTSSIYKNAIFPYKIFVPECDADEFALSVNHDGLIEGEAYALQELACTGDAPFCICVGIIPARLPSTSSDGFDRNLRMNTYDVYSEKYPGFIVDEFIPYITEKYSLKISASPDMHLITGGSSGGISAWNIAFSRNDYFRRVYMSSPSFLSMAKGDEILNLIRKFETKPIRVFVDYSENEPDEYFGSSFCVAEASIRALRYAGYDMKSEYHPGEGHCSRLWDPEYALGRMRFLWNGWKNESVTVNGYSCRAEKILLPDCPWKKCDGIFPENKSDGGYTFDGGNIFFTDKNGTKTTVADGFDEITAVTLSSDKWRLYISDKRRGGIYAATVMPDGTLDGIYTNGALHLKTDFRLPGAFDICVDHEDRIYAATEIGIQCIRSYGLIDVILENPDGRHADRIAIGDDGYIYAMCGSDLYSRKLNCKLPASPDRITEPKQGSYYD